MNKSLGNSGFGLIGFLVIIVVLAAIGVCGWAIWHSQQTKVTDNKSTSKTSGPNTKSSNTTTTPASPYVGWKTYTDTGYSLSSGITVKYPSNWKVNVGNSNAYAWEIVESADPNVAINVRDVFLASTTTPMQEWTNCPSADACGPGPGDTKISGTSSTINDLASYSTEMQNSSNTQYYATVIKGNTTTSNGTVFVEFIVNNPDSSTLRTYNQIISSATFSN